MMDGGIATYKVVDATTHELLYRLITSIKEEKGLAEFDALSCDDPSETPRQERFEVRLLKLHLDQKPFAAEVIDQHGRYFQLVLHEDIEAIEFEIIT